MALVTRYFDVGPFASSIGAGIIGQIRYNAIKEAERKERERRRRRAWTMGLGAAAGAGVGLLAAPALGAAGILPTVQTGSTLAGGVAAPIMATTGLGTLAAGLGGGAIGAQAAGAFDEGNIAGGLGAIASPFVAAAGRQADRQQRMGDFRAMEGFRTDENIRQLLEAQNIRTYGATSGQIAGATRAFEAGMPAAGTELFPRIPDSEYAQLGPEPFGQEAVTALGPPRPNMPGPGPIPNTKYDWNAAQMAARMRVLQNYSDKVDNPNRRSNYTTEERQLLKESAERELENIRVQLMPDQPKTMIPAGPGGQLIPAQRGGQIDAQGNKWILQPDGSLDYRDAPKDFTKNFTADWTPEQTKAYLRKQVPDYDEMYKDGHRFFVRPDGIPVHIKPETDTEGFKWDENKEYDAAIKRIREANPVTKDEAPYDPDEEEIVEEMQGKKTALERRTPESRKAAYAESLGTRLHDLRKAYPGGPSTMPLEKQKEYKAMLDRYIAAGGR